MRQNISIFFLVSLLLTGVSVVFRKSYELGLCYSDRTLQVYDVSCHMFYESIGDPLFYGMGALTVIFGVSYLIPNSYRSWQRFAIWYLPLYVSLLVFYDPGSGNLFSPSTITVYKWTSYVFAFLSILVILFNARSTSTSDTAPLIKPRWLKMLWLLYIGWILYSVGTYYI